MELVKEPPQERRGVDYSTMIFNAYEPGAFRDTFGEIVDIFEECHGSLSFEQAGSDPHYSRVALNELRCRLAFTPPEDLEGRNRGQICLTLPGAFFYLLDESAFCECFFRLSGLKWFSHFTRLDFQSTELEPQVDAEQMLGMVRDGKLWVKGARTWRPWEERNAANELTDGVTIYWGSGRSEKTGKSYDKAKQKPHWPMPAVRDEVVTRGKWARVHGDHLIREMRDAGTIAERLAVMQKNATFALSQHLMYHEVGAVPTSDKNWVRTAKKADWYVKRIGKATRPLQRPKDQRLDLERAVEAGLRQYGRTFYRYAWETARRTDAAFEDVTAMLFARMQASLTEEDLSWLCPGGSEQDLAEWRAHLAEVKDDVALGNEHGWLVER